MWNSQDLGPLVITLLLNELSLRHSEKKKDTQSTHWTAMDSKARKMCPVLSVFFLLVLVRTSLGSEIGNNTSIEIPARQATVFGDVSSAKAFIDSTDIAVVGFFVDLEAPEVEYFNTVVTKHPEWDYGTSSTTEVLKHYKIKSNTITIFRKADNFRDDFVVNENPELNVAKLYRYLTINELRLVTDYNPMSAIGIMACKVQVHLLFFTHKDVERQEEIVKELREAAKDLRGKVLFVKIDVGMRSNQKITALFKLNKSDLPLISIYDTEGDRKQTMGSGEFTAERVKTFCLSFLSGNNTEESERKDAKTEL
ncbi:endoplasmic reticulum resident protein 27 [Pseudophryne corroboree]|uniref:endoplasmic reticulum resident protein 27 n=1 Tax=Pseudophryne corroboree TaxID=495146 RepID=UPI003081A648